MLLSARPLRDVSGVNSFEVDQVWETTEGNETSLYFQLIDASLDRSSDGFSPSGRRYMPAASSSLSVVIDSLDDAKRITRYASQPYAQDGSIWKLDILSTDAGKVKGTPTLRFKLVEGSKVTYGSLKGALLISEIRNCP